MRVVTTRSPLSRTLNGAMVPKLWTYEITNVLTLLIRRGRITAEHAVAIGAALATQHALSGYDSSYLILAVAAKARLATLDGALRAAAVGRGIAFTGHD